MHRLSFLLRLLERSLTKLVDDDGPNLAAAIAYRVLFSLFPLAIVLTGVFGIVVRVTGVRADIVDTIVRNLPLDDSGAQQIRDLLEGATGAASAVGLVALVGVVWAASGMMAAIRSGLNRAFDVDEGRPFLRGKLVDVLLVLATGVVVVASLVLTVAARALAGTTARIGIDADSGLAQLVLGLLAPLGLAFGVLLFLYLALPARRVRLEDAWPPAVAAACGLVLAQNLFALYVRSFASYNAVYGSLGAVIAFMVFVQIGALIFLLGAEVAAALPRVRDEAARGELAGDDDGPGFGRRLLGFLKSLWMHEPRT